MNTHTHTHTHRIPSACQSLRERKRQGEGSRHFVNSPARWVTTLTFVWKHLPRLIWHWKKQTVHRCFLNVSRSPGTNTALWVHIGILSHTYSTMKALRRIETESGARIVLRNSEWSSAGYRGDPTRTARSKRRPSHQRRLYHKSIQTKMRNCSVRLWPGERKPSVQSKKKNREFPPVASVWLVLSVLTSLSLGLVYQGCCRTFLSNTPARIPVSV